MPAESNHWLPARLEELEKDGAWLARQLKVPKQTIYRLWIPDPRTKKTRGLKQDEIIPMARHLDWSVEELVARANGVPFNRAKHGTEISADAYLSDLEMPSNQTVMFRAAQILKGGREGYLLHAELAAADLEQSPTNEIVKKPFTFKVINGRNEPVYRLRDTVTVDPGYEIVLGEDCLFTAADWSPSGGFCVIARLVREAGALWICQSIGASPEEFNLPKSEFPNAWAITVRQRPK